MKRGSPLVTPDGRYIIVRGRLWRATNPQLLPDRRDLLVHDLMEARRAVATAGQSQDAAAEAGARSAVDAAKRALGERGAPWWTDGAPDLNRHMVCNTPYAPWFNALPSANGDAMAIGTAGWSIPKAVAGAFPGTGTHLERYAAVMNAAEINSSFYRPHRASTYRRWAESTPDFFRFAVKIPKEISHIRRLVDTQTLLNAFADQIGALGNKLAIVLLQLPPSFAFDAELAAQFFAQASRRLGPGVNIAAEPRHASWSTPEADACLGEHRVARVAADPARANGNAQPGGWQGVHYRRLHGSPRIYYSAYDDKVLAGLANEIAADLAGGRPSWCIFDNTAAGAALNDARKLQALLKDCGKT